MRRALCALACALALLAGCSSGGSAAPKEYDVAATAQALRDSGAFSQELEALDADMVSAYLGLETEPEEAAVYTSLEGGYEELAVLKMASEDDAKAALEAVQAHVKAQRDTEADVQYKPGDLPKLESAVTRQAGKTVLLVVADDYDKVQAALEP